MKTLNSRDLIEVMPASGFRALFHNSKGEPFAVPLVCFALVEYPTQASLREVVGMIAGKSIQVAQDRPNFLRYIGPHERLDDYIAEALLKLKNGGGNGG